MDVLTGVRTGGSRLSNAEATVVRVFDCDMQGRPEDPEDSPTPPWGLRPSMAQHLAPTATELGRQCPLDSQVLTGGVRSDRVGCCGDAKMIRSAP